MSGLEALTLFTARQFLLWLGLEVIYCIQCHVTECVGPMLSALLTIILEAPTLMLPDLPTPLTLSVMVSFMYQLVWAAVPYY